MAFFRPLFAALNTEDALITSCTLYGAASSIQNTERNVNKTRSPAISGLIGAMFGNIVGYAIVEPIIPRRFYFIVPMVLSTAVVYQQYKIVNEREN